MYKIQYLPQAKTDLAEIVDYISTELHAPKAVLDLLDDLEHSIEILGKFPYSHRVYIPIKALECEYRILPVNNYLVFYTVIEHEKIVEISRILYGRMNVDSLIK
jgi:addiction module RelE/StbE family toxin